MGKFIKYLVRWQLSTPILAIILYFLPFNYIIKTIIANLIGGIIFFWVDKKIFKGE
jgi:putative flippase GtrA